MEHANPHKGSPDRWRTDTAPYISLLYEYSVHGSSPSWIQSFMHGAHGASKVGISEVDPDHVNGAGTGINNYPLKVPPGQLELSFLQATTTTLLFAQPLRLSSHWTVSAMRH
jgi:hypothetical protein